MNSLKRGIGAPAKGGPARLRRSSHAGIEEFPHVPKNDKGGVLVTEAELRAAFDFFDVDQSGAVTMKNLRKRLGVFYRNMPPSEYRFLMNKKDELKFEDLKELLMDNEVRGVDPVAEAFKAYEPDETGAIRPETLRRVFQDLGFGEIAEDDVEILTETADINKDGKITLEDFRALLESPNGAASPAREAPEEAAEREAATPEDDDAGGEEDDES